MSLQTRRPRMSNLYLAILLLLATAVPATHAQLIVRQNAPLAGEMATQQIGGAGLLTSYGFVGALRCTQTVITNNGFGQQTDAIVGVTIRKGTLVDYMQVKCAPLERTARGGITWEEAKMYNGGWAGNINGGSETHFANCPVGYVISGFKAIYQGSNNFLQAIKFSCSQISRVGNFSLLPRGRQYFQIQTYSNHQWVSWYSGDQAIRSHSGYGGSFRYALAMALNDAVDLSPPSQRKAESTCTDGGAAALSVATGTDVAFTGFHKVVQAFQLFCYGGIEDVKKADPYLDPFEHGQ